MVKTWQYYYFIIRDLNVGVKMMNAHLCKCLPPEAHLEALGGASDQQDLKCPSLTLGWPLSHATQPSKEPGLWRRMGAYRMLPSPANVLTFPGSP